MNNLPKLDLLPELDPLPQQDNFTWCGWPDLNNLVFWPELAAWQPEQDDSGGAGNV